MVNDTGALLSRVEKLNASEPPKGDPLARNELIYSLYAEAEAMRAEVEEHEDSEDSKIVLKELDKIRASLCLDTRMKSGIAENLSSILRIFIFGWTLLLGSVLILLLVPLRWMHPFLRKYCGVQNDSLPMDLIVRTYNRCLCTAAGVYVSVQGADKMRGPTLLMFSHVSNLDPFCVASASPIHCKFIGKSILFLVPLFGWAAAATGAQPISRKNRAKAVKDLKALQDKYEKYGRSVAISPEGTRSKTGLLADFKKGPFYLWEDTKLTITPALLFGAYELWPPTQHFPMPGQVVVRLADTITIPANDGDGEEQEQEKKEGGDPALRQRARQVVRAEMLKQLTSKYPSHAGQPISSLPATTIIVFAMEYLSLVACLYIISTVLFGVWMSAFAAWGTQSIVAFHLVIVAAIDAVIYVFLIM